MNFINLLLLFMSVSFFGTLIVWAYDIIERHYRKEE
jgi:hypothetical protein